MMRLSDGGAARRMGLTKRPRSWDSSLVMSVLSPLPIELEVHNLRSFTGKPARLELDGGFTALVGINNAGKSSLLRMFWELRPVFQALQDIFGPSPARDVSRLLQGRPWGQSPQLAPGERIFPTGAPGDLTLTLRFGMSPHDPDDPFWPRTATITLNREHAISLSVETAEGRFPGSSDKPVSAAANGPDAGARRLYETKGRKVDVQPIGEAARFLTNVMYIGPFRNAINVGAGDYFDIRIGDAFITQLHQLKSGPSPEANEAIYRMTKELQRIFEFDELEINPTPDGRLQLNIDGFSYRSSEIGAGFAHFLLVAANVLTRQPSLLLIDEPELNLHPALQLDFLLLLGSYAPGGVIFATHSVGLARAAAERVYCVTRDAGVSQLTPYEDTPGLAALTGQLGFGGRTDLHFDGILLVEGVTEVKVFQQLLRLYRKEHRYVIVPLAGNALINANAGNELAELRRLSSRIFAVIDSERPQADAPLAANRGQFAAICGDLSIPCTVLQRRAIENYFPEHAVRATYGSQGRALGPYELPKQAGFSWNKARNWRVARGMGKTDLQGTDLAELLERL